MPLILSYRQKRESDHRNRAKLARRLGKLSGLALSITIGVTLQSEPELREALRGIAMPQAAIAATQRGGDKADQRAEVGTQPYQLAQRAAGSPPLVMPVAAVITPAAAGFAARQVPARYVLR